MQLGSSYAQTGLVLALLHGALCQPVLFGFLQPQALKPESKIDYSKYTHINLAFALPQDNGTWTYTGESTLPSLVEEIHGKGPKVLMSFGGWSGSAHFSNIVKDPSTKDAFVQNIVDYVRKNNLDGADIDWEFPGSDGNCNSFDKEKDVPNFLKFLQDMRQKFDTEFPDPNAKKLITLAVRVQPFQGPDGTPMSDVSEFAKVVDYAALMQYDINGPCINVTGPNAPLNFEKDKATQFSFASTIDDWTKAGWPANQLTAGFAFYGHSMSVLEDMMLDPANQYKPHSDVVPSGDLVDESATDKCTNKTSFSGAWRFNNLLKQDVLADPVTAKEPWVRQFDDITKTPWLFNKESKVYISYDDPESIKEKAAFAASKGLAGGMIWSIEMDTADQALTRAILDNWPSA
ncbi:hypothetical protein CDD81_2226 [Ophiocordyceps australis]|uniref:chitinase n=1 Tax=Ophiocordyceps australis TaxID=1399860 RepID=A0A2C5XYG4_9HYPO|nr:hypothetical protein CDD81_2226 [Ophiocordyceps australis]